MMKVRILKVYYHFVNYTIAQICVICYYEIG